MAKTNPKPAATQSRLFVLALGLLVGFVTAFVFVLSRLPVDGIIGQHGIAGERSADVADMNFDYYSVLQEQEAERRPASRAVAVEPPVIFLEPPSNVQRIQQPAVAQVAVAPQIQQRVAPSQPPVAAPPTAQPQPAPLPQVREILASETGQDAYYVEAGNYRVNEDALQLQSSLRSLGLDAFIVVRQDKNGSFGHRVRIGPFFEQARLDATRNRLRASGIKPRLIRVKG